VAAKKTNDDPRSDLELIDAVNSGDDHAFELLYLRYRDWVVKLAMRFCGDQDLALDVLQETFIYFLKKFPGFVLTAQLKTFLYPTVKHLAIAASKKRRRHPQQPEDQPLELVAPDAPEDENTDQTRQALGQLLTNLPAHQSEVLLLRYVDGFNLKEIAAALDIPEGTVKSRAHLGLKALKQDPKIARYFQDSQ